MNGDIRTHLEASIPHELLLLVFCRVWMLQVLIEPSSQFISGLLGKITAPFSLFDSVHCSSAHVKLVPVPSIVYLTCSEWRSLGEWHSGVPVRTVVHHAVWIFWFVVDVRRWIPRFPLRRIRLMIYCAMSRISCMVLHIVVG